ncbi:MAG: PAS domain S-box protein [Nitrospirae bacterium]|nr:PAS domain S-box protein [Nitrospirota bacterium]
MTPKPSCESARLEALYRYEILGTGPDSAFDDLARLASYICRTPIAVISFVDAERQWFKSSVGLDHKEARRETAFCAHTILGTDCFIVEKADADERFRDHPWVVEQPALRFYAGVPLTTPDGYAIGSLAVMDVAPRTLSPEQLACLRTIANQVMAQLELRRASRSDIRQEQVRRKETEDSVQAILDRTAHHAGPAYFSALVQELATITGVDHAFCARVLPGGSRAQTMALWSGGSVQPNFEYDLAGTPCEQVNGGTLCHYPTGVQTLFPDDILLQQMGIESYMGFPLLGSQGTPVGWISIMGAEAIQAPARAEAILRFCGGKAGSELERMEAEAARWNSQQLLENVIENIPLAVFIKDPKDEFRVQLWNKAAESIFGIPRTDMLGRNAHDLWPKQQADSYLDDDRRCIAEGHIHDIAEEPSISHARGDIVVHTRKVPLFDAAGNAIHLLALCEDITEQRKAEEFIRENEHKFRSIFEQAPVGIATIDSVTGRFKSVNTSYCRIIGYTGEEMLSHTFLDITHPDDRQADLDQMKRLLDGEIATFEMDKRLFRKNGDAIWVHLTCVPLWQRPSDPRVHLAIVQDITERKRAEEERSKQELLISLMLSTGPGCIKRVAADGTLLHMNPAGLTMIEACREEEAIGLLVFDLVLPEHRTAFINMHQDVINGASRILQFEIQGLKGSRRWMETYAVPFRNPVTGSMEHLAVTHDITERKQAEEALRESEQAIRALYEATAAVGLSFNERMQAVLEVGCQRFGLPIGMLTRAVDEKLEFTHVCAPGTGFTAGMDVPLDATYCNTTLQATGPVCFEHAKVSEWRNHPGYKALGLESYIGTKLIGRERVYGTICFTGQDPRPASFSQSDKDFIQLMARWISGELDRQKAEQALKQSEKRYRALYDGTPTMYFTLATDGTVLSVNRFGAEQLGYRVDELVGQSVLGIFHEEDKETVSTSLSECLATPEITKHWEFRKVRKDGSMMWVREVAHVGQSSTGETVVLVTCEDVTEHKRTEQALTFFRTLLDHVDDSIEIIDPHTGQFLDGNKGAASNIGYTRDEFLTLTVPDIDPLVTMPVFAGLMERLREAPKTMILDSLHRRKDGTTFPVEVSAQLIRLEKDYLVAVVRDSTERKRIEEALRSSEERFRLVAEATRDILWDWDLVTDEHWWSPNARERFGYDPNAEPSIDAWTNRLHHDDRDKVLALVKHALSSNLRVFSGEYRFRLADGSYGHFYDRGQIVRDPSGKPTRMIGAMIDVTGAKQAYASLQEAYRRLQAMANELQRVESNERRRLSRELHDEVGQLLTALKFDLESMRRGGIGKRKLPPIQVTERLTRALETTDLLFTRLRLIVRALRPPVLEALGLKAALESLAADVQAHTGLACSVVIEGNDRQPGLAPTRETALYRIAQELLTNVIRHAQAKTASISLAIDPDHWILVVEDDGIGFDPTALPLAGGVGLRGIRERVEILGGRIDFTSQHGQGTLAVVWIPVVADPPPRTARKLKRAPSVRPRRQKQAHD